MPSSSVDLVRSPDFVELVALLPPAIANVAGQLVALLSAQPGLSGKVMRGWRSVNFRHGKAGHVCAVFPYEDRVSLYFEHGNLLEHGDGLLLGDDLKRGRYLRFYPGDALPVDRIGILVSEAIALFA